MQNLQLYSFTVCHWWKPLIHFTVRTLPSSRARQLPIKHSSHMHTCILFLFPCPPWPLHMYRFYWHHIPLVSTDTGWPTRTTLHSLDHMSNTDTNRHTCTMTQTECICTSCGLLANVHMYTNVMCKGVVAHTYKLPETHAHISTCTQSHRHMNIQTHCKVCTDAHIHTCVCTPTH